MPNPTFTEAQQLELRRYPFKVNHLIHLTDDILEVIRIEIIINDNRLYLSLISIILFV